VPLSDGDRAFTGEILGSEPELVYAGATSFCRRRYTRELDGVDVVVSGVPFDAATTYRPGARLGPRAVRIASANLVFGSVWPWNLDPFDTLAVTDWGDVVSPEGRWEPMVEAVEAHVARVTAAGARMLTIGGDHYVSLPLLRAHHAHYGPLALVHFDAHSDTWVDDHPHHGTMFRQAVDEGLVDVEHSVQIGVRTHNADDCDFAILTAPWVHLNGPIATAAYVRERVGDARAYLSFDVDCLDPAYAPGTGTPVIGGLSTAQAQMILWGMVAIDFVGMDVMEVSPPYDHAEVTALAAATLALDWLCLLATRKEGGGPPEFRQGGSGRAFGGGPIPEADRK
jgi:agmatinase